MSGHLFFEPSLSLFNSMDVDSGNGAGAEDWTQGDSHFHSPPPPVLPLASTARPQPPMLPNGNSSNSHDHIHIHIHTPPAAAQGAGAPSIFGLGQTPSPGAAASVVTPPIASSMRQASTQSDSMAQSTNGMAPAATAATAATVSARSREREQLLGGTLMFRNPLPVATISVHGREFFVHAELLCKHSDYFTRCLRGGFAEAETQRVVIDDDDVAVEDFGLWVDLLYRWHFHKPDTFLLRKEETGGTLSTMQILTLWQLSDRFLHKPLAGLAEESLQHRLSLYSVEQWRKLYRTRPASDIKSRVSRLQDAYRYCCDHELPFTDAIVVACANCPPQVYSDCAAMLDADFMVPVSRRMIMAHADSSLVSKDQRMNAPPGGGLAGLAAAGGKGGA